MIIELKYFHDKCAQSPLTFKEYNYFRDKSYQEMNFKSHSNAIKLCKLGSLCQICTRPVRFYFILIVCTKFCNKIERYLL